MSNLSQHHRIPVQIPDPRSCETKGKAVFVTNFWGGGVQQQIAASVPRAAVTKHHKLGDLNNLHLLSHSCRAQKAKAKMLAGPVSF